MLEEQKKITTVTVRLQQEEKDRLVLWASENNMTISQAIRNMIRHLDVPNRLKISYIDD